MQTLRWTNLPRNVTGWIEEDASAHCQVCEHWMQSVTGTCFVPQSLVLATSAQRQREIRPLLVEPGFSIHRVTVKYTIKYIFRNVYVATSTVGKDRFIATFIYTIYL